MSPLLRLLPLVAFGSFAALCASAPPPDGAFAIRMLRTLPGDSARVDVAADILPLDGGAIVAGWTTRADSAADAFMLRVDTTGTMQWRRNIGGPGADILFSIQPDPRGGWIGVGLTTSHGEGGDGWIVRFDEEGRVREERHEGGPGHDRLTGIVPAPGGGFLAAGQTAHGANIEAWVLRLDAGGRRVAEWTWGGAGIDRALGLVATGDGGVVLTGATTSLPGADSAAAGAEGFVVRLDAAGRPAWVHRFGGPGDQLGYHLRANRDGSLLVTGYGEGAAGRDVDAILLRVDPDGGERWRSALGDSAVDRAVQADVLEDGSSVVVGYARARGLANDTPVWSTMLHGVHADGRPTWSLSLGGPGRESGRWIARHGDELWVTGQEASADGGSRVFVARIAPPR